MLGLWISALLLSFLGWGVAFVRAIQGDLESEGVGRLTMIGLAVVLAIAGSLLAARAVSPAANFVVIGGGILAALFHGKSLWSLMRQGAARLVALPPRDKLILCGAVLILGVRVTWTAFSEPANLGDDFVAYLSYPKSMLETGDLREPFSLRRMAALGGQSYLHSLLMMLFPVQRTPVIDDTLFVLILAAMMLKRSLAHEGLKRTGCLIAAALITGLNVHHGNLASQMSGVAMFYFLADCIFSWQSERPIGWGRASTSLAPFALVAAATATLRANYILPIAGLSLIFAVKIARQTEPPAHSAFRRLVLAAGSIGIATLLLLLPWSYVLYRSSGTWLYPLFKGNQVNPHFSAPNGYEFNTPFWYVRGLLILPLVHLLTLNGLVHASRRFDGKLLATITQVVCVALISGLCLVAAFPTSDTYALLRYASPYCIGILAAVVLALAPEIVEVARGLPWCPWRVAAGQRFSASATILAAACLFGGLAFPSVPYVVKMAMTLRQKPEVPSIPPDGAPQSAAAYAAVQAKIYPGCAFAAAVDRPFLLDYRRNSVANLDWVGTVFPPPGQLSLNSLQEFTEYLRAQGFDYVLAHAGDSSLFMYSPTVWEQSVLVDKEGREGFRSTVVYAADRFRRYFQLVTQARQKGLTCYDDGVFVVIPTEAGSCNRPCDSRGTAENR